MLDRRRGTKMLKISLAALFLMTMATLTIAASAIPVPTTETRVELAGLL